MKPLHERLWAKIQRGNDDECWPFTGSLNTHGYGHLSGGAANNHRSLLAHRLVYAEIHGPIPDGGVVRHRCDNPACCNPAHLQLGTHSDNMEDAFKRGRKRPPLEKISPAQREALRADARPQKEIAAEYGVHRNTIYKQRRDR